MTTKKVEKTKIINITRIEKFVGKTYNTLRKWKLNLGFPMFKEGGQWVAFQEDIKEWQRCQAKGEKYEPVKKKTTRGSASK